MVKVKEKKYLKTFSIHVKDLSLVHQFSQHINQQMQGLAMGKTGKNG